jgi:aminoglycoside phosphotransferase family enzyme
MECWHEEWEIKQADFLRCIRSFGKMSSVWQAIASNTVEAGKCTYTKHKSAVFKEMEKHARTLFNDAGYGNLLDHLLDNNEGKILADYVFLE